MARGKTPTLTEAELKLMKVVWERGEATVGDVIEGLPKSNRLAYNTVLTTMRILENKGYLSRVKAGRAHVYRPLVSRSQARRKVVRHVVSSFFNDSPELLLASILKNEDLSAEDLEKLRRMIDEGSEG